MHNNSITRQFALSCMLVSVLLIGRFWYTHSFFYGFLLWNLLLAYIPFAISQYITNRSQHQQGTRHLAQWWVAFPVWLLFFPNAPYIITDITHLTKRNDIPKWYDAALLFTAAGTGLWIGCISLMQMEKLWKKNVPSVVTGFFITGTFILCGFGIYLGRFVRLNSWEVVTNPVYVAEVIVSRLLQPFKHMHTWFITGMFAAVLFVFYMQIKQLMTVKYCTAH